MSHDFAKVRNRKRAEQTPPPAPPQPSKGMLLTGLLTGLTLGVFLSFLVYMSGILPPVGALSEESAQAREAELLAAQQRRNEELEQAAARLQLEFYKELPNYEVIVDNMPQPSSTSTPALVSIPAPRAEDSAQAAAPTGDSPAPATPALAQIVESMPMPAVTGEGTYMIQAGAFQTESSAMLQSERLIALGLSARVKKEALLGKTLFLVQTGPYNTRDEANQAERVLRGNGIDSIRIGLSQ